MLFIVVVVSCVMMKIVFCSALSHEVLNSQHYKHSQSTEACADDAKKWAGFTTACANISIISHVHYTVKNCCKIYSDLLAILVASKTVNLQKFCKSIITIVL